MKHVYFRQMRQKKREGFRVPLKSCSENYQITNYIGRFINIGAGAQFGPEQTSALLYGRVS